MCCRWTGFTAADGPSGQLLAVSEVIGAADAAGAGSAGVVEVAGVADVVGAACSTGVVDVAGVADDALCLLLALRQHSGHVLDGDVLGVLPLGAIEELGEVIHLVLGEAYRGYKLCASRHDGFQLGVSFVLHRCML